MPAYKKAIDPAYKDVLHEVPYQDMPVRKGASRRPNLGTQVVIPKGSPTAGGAIRRVDPQIVRQGYRLIERIKQPNDQRQLREHQGVGKAWKRKGR